MDMMETAAGLGALRSAARRHMKDGEADSEEFAGAGASPCRNSWTRPIRYLTPDLIAD